MLSLTRQNYQKNIALFQKTKKELFKLLPHSILIEHIGSTALPHMSGKNIIDILIGVPALSDVEPIAQQIEKMNFFRGKNHATGAYIFLVLKKMKQQTGIFIYI